MSDDYIVEIIHSYLILTSSVTINDENELDKILLNAVSHCKWTYELYSDEDEKITKFKNALKNIKEVLHERIIKHIRYFSNI